MNKTISSLVDGARENGGGGRGKGWQGRKERLRKGGGILWLRKGSVTGWYRKG